MLYYTQSVSITKKENNYTIQFRVQPSIVVILELCPRASDSSYFGYLENIGKNIRSICIPSSSYVRLRIDRLDIVNIKILLLVSYLPNKYSFVDNNLEKRNSS